MQLSIHFLFFISIFFVIYEFGNFANDDRVVVFENHANKLLKVPPDIENVTQQTRKVDDKMDCVFAFNSEVSWCRSVNYETEPEKDEKHVCELLSADNFTHRNYVIENSSFVMMSIKNPCVSVQCLNGGSCMVRNRLDYKCQCMAGFAGQNCEIGTIRLVNSSNNYEGRVEVFHNGVWGTVCDDRWEINAATVACRQLNFKSAQTASTLAFGQGTGKIWLDNVECTGKEKYVQDCKRAPWGESNCEHKEDVGIICNP